MCLGWLLNKMSGEFVPFTFAIACMCSANTSKLLEKDGPAWHEHWFTAVGLHSSNSFVKIFLQQSYWTEGEPSVYLHGTNKQTI